MKYYLYWVHRKCFTSIKTEGYLGVTGTPERRFKGHKNLARKGSPYHVHAAIRKYDDIMFNIICIGDVDYIKKLEYQLRSEPNVGWNMKRGGGVTELEMSEKKKDGYKAMALKKVKVSRFDIIKMMIDYHLRGFNYKGIATKFKVKIGLVRYHIKGIGSIYPELNCYRLILEKLHKFYPHNIQDISEEMYNSILDDRGKAFTYSELEAKYRIKKSSLKSICKGIAKYVIKFKSYRGRIIREEPKVIKYKNKVKKVSEWAEIVGIDPRVLRLRLRAGWSIEKAFKTPIGKRPLPPITYLGKTKTIKEWASQFGITTLAIRNRLRAGWPIEQLFIPPTPIGKRRGKNENQT